MGPIFSPYMPLTLCIPGKLLFFFSKSTFSKNSFRNTIRVSSSLDPDQTRRFVGPDLVPNCLHKLLAVDTRSKELKARFIGCFYYYYYFLFPFIIINIDSPIYLDTGLEFPINTEHYSIFCISAVCSRHNTKPGLVKQNYSKVRASTILKKR